MKLENKRRIVRISALVRMFDTFTQLRLFEAVLKQGKSSDLDISELFKELFNIDLSIHQRTKDEDVNKCIELDSELEYLIECYTGFDFLKFDRENIMAFLNYTENKNHSLKINHLMYRSVMEIISAYYADMITDDEFFKSINYYKNLTFPVFPLNIKSMVKCLQETEKSFITISELRTTRKQLKDGIKPI
ncbi:hypothetical protein [Chryseobacterium bernardetii]|uniref:hypothetical protein n=1 Tax=Chryseobacterium bernardetii TaxID=1241978 RepID=UPI001627EB4B|nr:hypothetical protein [Chryseobacterium bernardetii]